MIDIDDIPEEELVKAIRNGELQQSLIQWLTLNNIKWFKGQVLQGNDWVPFTNLIHKSELRKK